MVRHNSKEVVWRALTDIGFCLTRRRVELQEGVLHELVDFHNGSLVTASIAVVRGGEHGHHIPLMGPVVSVHHKLMSTRYQLQSVCVVELFRDVLSERVPSTSWGDSPSASIIGVRPQQVTNGTFMGNFLDSVELTNLVESVN